MEFEDPNIDIMQTPARTAAIVVAAPYLRIGPARPNLNLKNHDIDCQAGPRRPPRLLPVVTVIMPPGRCP